MTERDGNGEELFRVYWQPGCSSCLQAKEFLARHGIAFRSINVLSSQDALTELRALGARSVPVVAKGSRFVAAQDLDELATFLGVVRDHQPLPLPVLARRLSALLEHASLQTSKLTGEILSVELRPGRTVRDLCFHIPCVVEGFLEAEGGGRLTIDFFNRVPDVEMPIDALVEHADRTRRRVSEWNSSLSDDCAGQPILDTYYGRQPMTALLERTCWHIGQHLRQLEEAATRIDLRRVVRVDAELLAGLPLPDHIWDDEVGLDVSKTVRA